MNPVVVAPPSGTLVVCPSCETYRLSEVVSAMSWALDLTEGQPAGHAMRSAWIGMRIADTLQLPEEDRAALFFALLMKDLGCSSNAAKVAYLFGSDDQNTKRDFKTTDWTRLYDTLGYIARNISPDGSVFRKARQFLRLGAAGPKEARQLVKTRCERGASIARLLELPEAAAQAIRALDEHWDGRGHPDGLKGDQIPLLARIMGLAQTVEVFWARDGKQAALEMARRRSKRWFDPHLVKVLLTLKDDDDFWQHLAGDDLPARLADLQPRDVRMAVDDRALDRLSWAFAQVVDAKSPWTWRHSEGVAELATGIGQTLGLSLNDLRTVRRGALLHDIGKLGVSNRILDKPGRLTDDEFAQIQKHPAFGQAILSRVGCFAGEAELAATHHEKLDGSGYFRRLTGESMPLTTRIMVVADMCEALSADRPYRETLSREKVLSILREQAPHALSPEVLEALIRFLDDSGWKPRPRPIDVDACPI